MKNILFVANGLPAEETQDALDRALVRAGFAAGRVILADFDVGAYAWDHYQDELDAVVTDHIGRADGVRDLVRHIRAHDQEIPILVMGSAPDVWAKNHPDIASLAQPVLYACPVVVKLLQERYGAVGGRARCALGRSRQKHMPGLA